LPLRSPALGDVVVGPDPVFAARYRAVDNRYGAPIRRFGDHAERPAGGHGFHDISAITRRVGLQRAGFGPVANNVGEHSAGLHQAWRQAVHGRIPVIADDQTASVVEHHHALVHIVQGDAEQTAFVVDPAVGKRADQAHAQYRDRHAGDGNGEQAR
jgi:hypothetical protein